MGNDNQGTRSEMNRPFRYYSRKEKSIKLFMLKRISYLDHMQCTLLEKGSWLCKKNLFIHILCTWYLIPLSYTENIVLLFKFEIFIIQ